MATEQVSSILSDQTGIERIKHDYVPQVCAPPARVPELARPRALAAPARPSVPSDDAGPNRMQSDAIRSHHHRMAPVLIG